MATQSWLSAVRISPEQKRHKGGKIDRDSENKRKKKRKETSKRIKQGVPAQLSASRICQRKKVMFATDEPRSARQCRRARFPNSGCCCGCGCGRGAALLALSVSVRGRRAANAAFTTARRCSSTIVSVSLEVLTPLRSMIDVVGFSLSRQARSVPASDGIGRWLIHACGFEELGGSWGMIHTRVRMRERRNGIAVDLVDLVG